MSTDKPTAAPVLNPALEILLEQRDQAIARAERLEGAYSDVLRNARSAQDQIDIDLRMATSLQESIDTLKNPGVPREVRSMPRTAAAAREALR